MISHTVIGSNDIETALAFYDNVFGVINVKRAHQVRKLTYYGCGFDDGPMFGVTKPYNKQSASAGNGSMVALRISEPKHVDQMHAIALDLGAICDGAPGVRGRDDQHVIYGAYFRDLDGNKIALMCWLDVARAEALELSNQAAEFHSTPQGFYPEGHRVR